jgi:hypothetical protein
VIRHVVAFELAAEEETARRRDALDFAARLEGLRDVVEGVLAINVHHDLGLVTSHWPLVLVADFESLEVLEAYQSHPRHREVIDWANDGVVANRAVVDFELTDATV